jgi:hypothetical protein
MLDQGTFFWFPAIIFLLMLIVPLALLGLAALFNWLASRTGKVMINGQVVLKGLRGVPDPTFFNRFWQFASRVRENPHALEQYNSEVGRIREMIAHVETPEFVRTAACQAGAGVRMAVLAPEIFKEVFGSSAPADDEVDADWVQKVIESYEKNRDLVWNVLDPLLEVEWILSIGTTTRELTSGELIYLITTRRVFAFSREKLTLGIEVPSIERFEVTM